MANLAFRILQKSNKNNLKYFYINTPGLLSVPKEYIQYGNYRLYLGSTFFDSDIEIEYANKYLITNSVHYYLNNRSTNTKLRFIPWYNVISNIKMDMSGNIDDKETDIVLDGMYSIPIVSKLNIFNDIFEELSAIYNNIYVDCNYLNYLAESVKYNKNSDISSKVTFVVDDLKHSFNYRNIFIPNLDEIDEVVNLSFLKFAFFGMHLDNINVVWHNSSALTNDILRNYLSLLDINDFAEEDNFISCNINLVSLSSKILKLENISYDLLSNIENDYFKDCNIVNDFILELDSIGGDI